MQFVMYYLQETAIMVVFWSKISWYTTFRYKFKVQDLLAPDCGLKQIAEHCCLWGTGAQVLSRA